MKAFHMITYTLVIVGALNWGLVGLFDFNLVTALGLPLEMVNGLYILIGASAVYDFAMHMKYCMWCSGMMEKGKKKK